ncbi:accessory Sec system glycosyltransferase Asp1 [Lacticaseibacillus sp. 866-1]|uniref:accessory Sec system glycosyltransferase Asp1 n=1 Tax=Lacticaseibacillus sp. 866-1 TaxID=2799576 RepID=UPI0019419AC8|nr:accessory Sec system glycosyltransferase Asp1 [Lacticaseibacillus sp. 866-1]
MNFFINETMHAQKSGIEHAELKRFKLFNEHGADCRIVIRNWDPELHENTRQAGIPDAQLISMFDYFQHAEQVKDRRITLADLDFGVANTTVKHEPGKNRVLVTAGGQLVARVNFWPDAQRVHSTELFDAFGNLYLVEQYDSRGFVSLQQWYTPDNQIGMETWLTPAGQPVLESYNRDDRQGKRQQAGWRLTERDGQVFQFATIEALTQQFLDDLNLAFWDLERPNVFVLDRSHLVEWGITRLKRPAYTVLYLHNAHTANAQDPDDPLLNNNYEFALSDVDAFDAVVSATRKQAEAVAQRFHPRAANFAIAVGVVPDQLLAAPRVPVARRQFGKIVAFARIAWEKHLDDLVRAVAIVHREIPQVTLDLYGYADPSDDYKARRQVEQVIKAEHLEKVVTLKGYTQDIDQIENSAMMFGVTSRMEGFNLAVMEAIAHGLIAFTYDVNYGPNEIVESGVNGQVVPYGDYCAMAEAMLKVLRDPALAQQYSAGAYESAKRYSSAAVWEQWQALLADAQANWPAKLIAARFCRPEEG